MFHSIGTKRHRLPVENILATVGCTLLTLASWLSLVPSAEAENRLGKETSPYLKLHAHNPVDWYPWGAEALKKAQQENKPIFLSVGYSSCYWCHVMERESFMDDEIAKLLNENFVCIKVDREERPDIDAIYMLAVQLQTGRGGWPMSVFLTPDAKPFWGGTYFPARDGDRGPATGFLTITNTMSQLWGQKEKDLRLRGDQFTEAIRANLDVQHEQQDMKLDTSIVGSVVRALTQQFDPQYGGFGFDPGEPGRPKFPEPSNLLFLLHQAREGDDAAQRMVMDTLDKMHGGGIWDHVGGGFHRYSVDRFWHIPHFEKMLYDNGQLATVYTQAYALTQRPAYRRVVERILDFVVRELRDTQGGFYSALDAESEKEEGKFYRWDKEEARQVLGQDYETFADIYGFDEPPNFEEHYYVPELRQTLAKTAEQRGVQEAELWGQLAPLHQKLLAARGKRPRPLTDTKILASWNGMMIRGFADAGRVLQRPDYIQVAEQASKFVLDHMRRPDGRLFRTHTSGTAKLNAYLDDYACFVDGLIALHQATGKSVWLEHADELTQLQIKLYGDEVRGGFYFTSTDHEALIARGKQPTDGAVPAGNSVSAQNLLYLAGQLRSDQYQTWARRTIEAGAINVQQRPQVAPRLTIALAEWLKANE